MGPGRAGHRHASAEELRRRAELLFAERGMERGESGAGPPEAGADAEEHGAGAEREGGAEAVEGRARVAGGWRDRAGAALRERMPVWLQARCGVERRSVAALTVVLVVAAGLAAQHFWSGRAEPVRAPDVVRAGAPFAGEERGAAEVSGAPDALGTSGASASDAVPGGAGAGAPGGPAAEIVVDVSGKVRRPGIHRLPAGARVVDALSAAGGVRPGTNTDGLNRARFLVDGEQVVVGGPAPPVGTGGGAAGAPGAGAGVGAGPGGVVSLSTATVEQLDTLPGVGPVLAQHIVDYRTRHGGFRAVDELREVNGIGERRFADLRNLVRP